MKQVKSKTPCGHAEARRGDVASPGPHSGYEEPVDLRPPGYLLVALSVAPGASGGAIPEDENLRPQSCLPRKQALSPRGANQPLQDVAAQAGDSRAHSHQGSPRPFGPTPAVLASGQ